MVCKSTRSVHCFHFAVKGRKNEWFCLIGQLIRKVLHTPLNVLPFTLLYCFICALSIFFFVEHWGSAFNSQASIEKIVWGIPQMFCQFCAQFLRLKTIKRKNDDYRKRVDWHTSSFSLFPFSSSSSLHNTPEWKNCYCPLRCNLEQSSSFSITIMRINSST